MQPRKSFLGQFLGRWGFWALLSLAVCAFAVIVAAADMISARRIAEEGAEAQASVTSTEVTSSSRKSIRKQRSHHVGYSLTVDGQLFEGKETVSAEFFQTIRTGDLIPVRYWTKDPSLVEIEPGHFASEARIGQIVAVVALGFVLFFATLGWRWAAAARWMVRNGVEREATVGRLVGAWFNFGNTAFYHAQWQDGTGATGHTRLHRAKALPGAGKQIKVLADPEGKRPAIWDGDL